MKSQKAVVEEDEERLGLARMMDVWEEFMGQVLFYAPGDVTKKAEACDNNGGHVYPELREVLEEEGMVDKQGKISAQRFGYWLKKREGIIVEGSKFVKRYDDDRKAFDWMLKKIGKSP